MSSTPRFLHPHTISPSQSSSLSLSSDNSSLRSRSNSGSSSNHGSTIQLHRYLHKTQEVIAHNIRSYILWDVREHPRNAQAVPQLPLRLPPDLLNAYATNPPVASLTVTCDYPKPWSTMVHASAANFFQGPPRAQVAGVTIADLLIAIYDRIHSQSVSTSELNALQPKQRTRVLEAYEKRCLMSRSTATPQNPSTSSTGTSASSTGGRAGEAVKLVDTFLLHTMFAGMEVDPDNGYTLILSVKRPN